jgi:hypothetical protein
MQRLSVLVFRYVIGVLGVLSSFWIVPANASLTGYDLRFAHIYTPSGEIGSAQGVLVTELSASLFDGNYIATIRDIGFSIEWTQGKHLQGLFGFNGFVLTVADGTPITFASIAASTDWPDYFSTPLQDPLAPRLTFDGNHVRVDMGFLTSLPSQRLDVTVLTAVPENSTVAMMCMGLLLLLFTTSSRLGVTGIRTPHS